MRPSSTQRLLCRLSRASTMGFLCVMISHLCLGRSFLSRVMHAFGLASGACRCALLS